MVTPIHRALRVSLVIASASALTLGPVVVPVAPAQVADTVTAADQPYFAYYHFGQARAKGYMDQGATIVMIDGPANVTAPELRDAHITDKSLYTVDASIESKNHGTAVASVLVTGEYSVAPEASLLSYMNVDKASIVGSDCATLEELDLISAVSLINHTINDGASTITNATNSKDHGNRTKWAVAQAINQGVITTDAISDEARDETADRLSYWSGVVGVPTVDANGAQATYSSWGQRVTTAAMGGTLTAREYPNGLLIQSNGTSVSTPIAAEFLTVARQKWPDATSSQLLQLLIHTTVNPDGGRNQYTGYDVANPVAMMDTDPSQYPDANFLTGRGGGSSPTPEEIAQYVDGVVPLAEIAFDNSYSYRGLDESVLSATTNPYPTRLGTSPRHYAK